MIRLVQGALEAQRAQAILRPVAADFSAVTPAMRRLELAGGPVLEEQCRRIGELPVGGAAITGAGALDAQFMVHVVVRSHDQPVSPQTVRQALLNGLRRLEEWGIEAVALPPLGTGAGNLDAEEAVSALLPLLREALASDEHPLTEATIVVETDYEREAFERALGSDAADAAGAAGPPR